MPTTLENLKEAFAGESQAEGDGHKAKRMFAYAVEAEAVHARLYTQAMEAAKNGKDLAVKDFYLCPVCGNFEFGNAPDKCPVCGTLGTKFVRG